MNFSLIYLIQRFFYRIIIFLADWYVESFIFINHRVINLLGRLDRFFAVEVNLKNLFNPLYQDHSILGHTLGFLFRLTKIVLGGAIYLIIAALGLSLYLIWTLIPIYILYFGFFSP